MSKHVSVFQMGFDIAVGADVNPEEKESLFNAIVELIDNFYDANGKRVEFQSLGQFFPENMDKQYAFYLEGQNKC